MALITCPECKNQISNKADSCPHCGYKKPKSQNIGCGTVIVIFIAIIMVFSWYQSYVENQEKLERQKAAAVHKKKLTEQKKQKDKALQDYFVKNKDQILDDIQSKIDAGDFDNAFSQANKYKSINNDKLTNLSNIAEEKILVEKVKKIPASHYTENLQIYTRLLALNPNEEKYRQMGEHYKNLLNKKLEAERLEKAKKEAERKKLLAEFGEKPVISQWDGSYFEVKKYLKQVANDPDSIEMDGCTDVYHTKNGWLVGCNYRGKNAFGALIRNSSWFTIRHGQVINVEEASAYKP